MASVQILPGILVAIAALDTHGIIPLYSRPLNGTTQNTVHRSLESQAEFIEIAMRFSGIEAAHAHIPVTDIRAAEGEYAFFSFVDGVTGMAKTAEFCALPAGAEPFGGNGATLPHAQHVGMIQVDLRHEKGSPVVDRTGSPHSVRHDNIYDTNLIGNIHATHHIRFNNPHFHPSTMIAVVNNAQVTDTGHFFFHFASQDAIRQLDLAPQVNPPTAPNILQDRTPSGHLLTGAPSTPLNPNLQHPNVGTVNNYPNAAAYAPLQGPVPPPAPPPNAPRMQLPGPGAYPPGYGRPPGAAPLSYLAAGFGFQGRNRWRFDSVYGIPAPQPLVAPDANGRIGAGPLNPTMAPAPAPTQQEVPGRRGSAPASHPNNAAAGSAPGRSGFGDFVAAQAMAGLAGVRAWSLPATPQTQPGTGSAQGSSLQAAQLKAAGAVLGANGIPRFAPSQARASTDSAGFGVPSTSATSQSQSMTAPAPVGASGYPSLATLEGLVLRPGTFLPDALRSQPWPQPAQDGLQTSQLNNAAPHFGRERPARHTASQSQAPASSAGGGSSLRPAVSKAPRKTTAGAARRPPLDLRATLRPVFTTQPAQDDLQTSQSDNTAPQDQAPTGSAGAGSFALPATSQAPPPSGSAGPGSSLDTAIVIDDPQATSTPLIDGHAASGLSVNLQSTSTTASAGPGASTIPVNPQAIPTPASADDSGGPSPLPITDTSQAQSLTASAGGDGSTVPVNPQASSMLANGDNGGAVSSVPVTGTSQAQSLTAPADAIGSTVSVNPQAVSTPVTGDGGVTPLPVVPQRASVTSAAPDSSGGPSRKKRKRGEEKQPKGSRGRTKK